MAVKVGRNDLCPCGSGEKYKKCCLLRETNVDPWHRLDSALRVRLMDYSQKRFSKDAFAAARTRPIADDALPIFIPWMLYHHRIEGQTVAEWYLQEHPGLDAGEADCLRLQILTPLSIWRVVRTVPGRELQLENTLTGLQQTVLDVAASRSLHPLQYTLARVTPGSPAFICGAHPMLLSPSQAFAVEEAFRSEQGEARLLEGPATLDLIRLWEAQVMAAQTRPGTLSNSDGEPLVPTATRMRFEASQRRAVFSALARHQAAGVRVDEVGQDMLVFTRAGTGGSVGTIVATVTFGPDSLEAQTNSAGRSDTVRASIESVTGGQAIFVETRPLSMGEYTEILHRTAPTQQPGLESGMEAMRQFKQRHYQSWLEQPLAFLQQKTPRDAAASPEGRRRLTVLLDDMDMRERQEPLFVRYDVGSLRRELGLPA